MIWSKHSSNQRVIRFSISKYDSTRLEHIFQTIQKFFGQVFHFSAENFTDYHENYRFQDTIIEIFDNALTLCHQIRQVHPFLLRNLKFPADLFLSSVGLLEKPVADVRDRLNLLYRNVLIPLKAYAKEFQKYLEFYMLPVQEYIKWVAN